MLEKSELIINNDGSIFHLHLKPEHLSDTVILVGDPGRVNMVSDYLENIEFLIQNREFISTTGYFNNKRITVVSTGIGTDNIDIVVNELDALANIDFDSRKIKKEKRTLNLIRIGTSGGIQQNIPLNAFVVSQKSIGFDGLLHFYANREKVSDISFENFLKKELNLKHDLISPYVVNASQILLEKFDSKEFIKGVNISAPGFYGPQGRSLRIALADKELKNRISNFEFNGYKITNYEMESSGIYGLAGLLGHQALTICAIIANRATGEANENYFGVMKTLIEIVLKRLTN